jgi:hypothetical protein
MGVAVWGLRFIPQVQALRPDLRLVALIAAGIAIYAVLAWREIAWCWRELRR